MLDGLIEYVPPDEDDIEDKEAFLKNIQNFYDGREMVIDAFIKKKYHWQMVLILNILKENLIKSQTFIGWKTRVNFKIL